MKVNEVLIEAGVADTVKAIMSQPGILADPANFMQTVNKLRTNRDVGQLTLAMIKVWNNVTTQERNRRQGLGGDGTLDDKSYRDLLIQFIEKNLIGGDLSTLSSEASQAIGTIINQVTDKRMDANAARLFPELFGQLIGASLLARAQKGDAQNTTNTGSSTGTPPGTPPPRTARGVADRLRAAGLNNTEIGKIRSAIAELGIDPIRTNDATAIALFQALGIPTS